MKTERRRYFRIDDSALIKYRVVPEGELDGARAQLAQHQINADNLRTAFEPLDARLAEMAPVLRRESRVLAEAIELLNRKLGLLAAALATEQGAGQAAGQTEHQPSAVNLSGGGLALRAREPVAANTWLLIDLVLLPGNHMIRAIGRVTDTRKRGGDYAMGIEFDALREEDRDALISHALRKQAQQLRQERAAQGRAD